MKAIITVGISCSGKSTLAADLAEEGWVDVNRDWIRFNVVMPNSDWRTYKFTRARENTVTELQEAMVVLAASQGKNVVISDTNLNVATREKWIKFLNENGFEVEIRDMPVSLEEAWKRDSYRLNGVGHNVIYSQYLKWLEYKGRKRYVPDPMKRSAVIVDIDGTLACMKGNGRSPFDWHRVGEDDLRETVAEMVSGLAFTHEIVVLSGRDGVCFDETWNWLEYHQIPFQNLFMRQEGDSRKDSVIKEEIFWAHVEPYWNVKAVVEDRPVMVRLWEELGIPTVISVANQLIEF